MSSSAFADGLITHFGSAETVSVELPPNISIRNYGPDARISAGFLDSHVHFQQTPMIGAFGPHLLDRVNTYLRFPPNGNTPTKGSRVRSRRSF